MKRILSLLCVAMLAMSGRALSMDLPMSPSDVQEALDYGANNSPTAIITNPAEQLGSGESETQPWGFIITPFQSLAFASAQAHAKYQDVGKELLHEVKTATTFQVVAEAFDTNLRMNDEMVVVIKQNGKVVHAVRKNLESDEDVITIDDDAGYRTSLTADFSYKSLDLKSSFTVVIANYSMSGREADFTVDPTAFR